MSGRTLVSLTHYRCENVYKNTVKLRGPTMIFDGPTLRTPDLDSIYVTDSNYNAIFLFMLSDLSMIKQVGKKGSGSEEFISPRQLAISPSQELYVPDQSNNRLQILSTNLVFQSSLQHQTRTTPVDVKFTTIRCLC